MISAILKKQMNLLNGVIIYYFCLSVNFLLIQLNLDGANGIDALN